MGMRQHMGSGNGRWPAGWGKTKYGNRGRAGLSRLMPGLCPCQRGQGQEGQERQRKGGQVQKRAQRAPIGVIVARVGLRIMRVDGHAVHHGVMMGGCVDRGGRVSRRGDVDPRQPHYGAAG
ncbi:hypothetical protein Gxy13693_053_002 [Komagataeibacter xylinus NBRC 13693]|uniref:Uncharacterized protein n=1 Tax=Komagataeibacter xylinus NBRC 13693 TaxID=1234668 RepID=A0A0D6QB70_KOMXY|nr:hypothetical protein Gxy13693_053_002 [Komagataeibacter xylinus NBRC 13693]